MLITGGFERKNNLSLFKILFVRKVKKKSIKNLTNEQCILRSN